jgi:hypothetical protein
MGFFSKKPADEARKKLAPLQVEIAELKVEVEDLEKQVRVAWGKKWSSTHMADRRRASATDGDRTPGRPVLGLDLREQILTLDLKRKKDQLDQLFEQERQLKELIDR